MPNDFIPVSKIQRDFARFHITLAAISASTFLEFCIKLVRETEPTIRDGLFTCSMMTLVVDCRLKRNQIPCVSLQPQRNGSVVKPHIHTFGIPAYVHILNKVNIHIRVVFHTQLDLTFTIGTLPSIL